MTSVFGVEWAAAYASTKGGVVQLTKSLAVAWARDNIQVNTILPGWITTDLTKNTKIQAPDRYEQISSRIPQNRWGEPEDLAGTAIFLSSSASDYVTGVSIPVDGGYTSF
jgi:2-deoxy-D-gluconate 3-dehydrogenase